MTASRDTALKVLRGCEWLAREPPALPDALLAHGRLLQLNAGEWAQAEGDDHRGLVVVISGLVHVSCQASGQRTVLIGHCEAGSVLGHATRYSGGPRLVTAVCAEPSVVLAVPERGLEAVAAQWPTLWRALATSAYSYTRRTVRALAELISLPPRQRLAARLLLIATPGESGEQVVRLSQQALGEMIGVSRKTVNAHLAALERRKLLTASYNHIILRDPRGLRRFADS
ncbi:MAG: Crp/Fnr family transcriptional regulator [Proteobacteria bacterium]|nr:Crp/Fnr family transcriptional regulator [Pseudomonadota bacterium]